MNKKSFFVSLVCLFLLSSCQFPWTKKVEIISLNPEVSPFEESLKLESDYIVNLRLRGLTDPGKESSYLVEKKNIVSTYESGDRSLNVLRAYIYLSALEGDFQTKERLEGELCQLYAEECSASLVQTFVSGVVQNSLGKALPGVTVEVLGTKHATVSDAQGKYTLSFVTQSPAVLRLRASSDTMMIGVKKIQIDDGIRKSFPTQKFERNFTLIAPFATHEIDTVAKTISGKDAQKNETGYVITTPFTKYTIPFDTIVEGTTPYRGKLSAMVFEFDRSSGGFLLDADAFDSIDGFATSLFVTYGMPYIILTAEDGTRLDVLSTNPMYVATTLRERDDNMRTKNFDILYQRAYDESQKQPGKYPITSKWLFDNGNLRIIPPWWVLDRSTGFWDNVGLRFATTNPEAPYNIEAPLYTVRVGKR